jgi:uncharacterized protein
MKPRELDPHRLDVLAFAQSRGSLAGEWPLSRLERLAASLSGSAPAQASVTWSATGEQEAVRGGAARTWLRLKAAAELPLVCQRCLGAVQMPLQIDRRFLWVADEATAERLDAELEDDVLVLSRECRCRRATSRWRRLPARLLPWRRLRPP